MVIVAHIVNALNAPGLQRLTETANVCLYVFCNLKLIMQYAKIELFKERQKRRRKKKEESRCQMHCHLSAVFVALNKSLNTLCASVS